MSDQPPEITQEQAAATTAQLAALKAQPDFAAKFVSKTDGYDVKREFARLVNLSQHGPGRAAPEQYDNDHDPRRAHPRFADRRS